MTIKKLGIQPLDLDFSSGTIDHIELVQGDTQTRGLTVRAISASGDVLTPSESVTCRLFGVNSNYPDKTYYSIGTIEGDRYVVYITTDMVSKAGKLSLQVALYEGESALIQSEIKELDVKKSLGQGGEVGQDLVIDFTKLNLAIERVEQLEETYTDSLAAQGVLSADVTEKHGQVVTMHASLAVVFESEESRVTAEIERRSAESARQTNETERKQSETERKQSETERKQEETERKESEINRKSAEVLRDGAEVERIASELGRKQAETARVGAEEGRVTAEEERVSAEVTRVEAESGRVGAENSRSATWSTWSELMSGVMPIATSEVAGVVKVDPTKDESTPHTVMTAEKAEEKLGRKVDKVTGKGLSTNDYTTAEKQKLSGIETNANKYTHPESHEMGMITGLQAALNGKAPTSHTHTIEQVEGLQTALDGKVASAVVKKIIIGTAGDVQSLTSGQLLLVVE